MDVWETALGFMDSQIVFAADELGVFDQLAERPCSAAVVADSTALPHDSAQRLLTALCAMELVHRDADGLYSNTAAAAGQLVRTAPGYIGGMFRHLRDDLYPVWGHFTHALREGRAQWQRAFPGHPAAHERLHNDPEALAQFLEGMHAITHRSAAHLTEMAEELRSLRSIVDVGGASGAFAIALAEANPSLTATVFDLPPVEPIASRCIAESGLADRVHFQGGCFWEDDLPSGKDAYSLGFILHDWDDDGQERLLARVAKACPPGGSLIVGEYLLNDQRTGPKWVARSDLNMLAAARGRERSAPEYRRRISAFGFTPGRMYLTNNGKSFLFFSRDRGAYT